MYGHHKYFNTTSHRDGELPPIGSGHSGNGANVPVIPDVFEAQQLEYTPGKATSMCPSFPADRIETVVTFFS